MNQLFMKKPLLLILLSLVFTNIILAQVERRTLTLDPGLYEIEPENEFTSFVFKSDAVEEVSIFLDDQWVRLQSEHHSPAELPGSQQIFLTEEKTNLKVKVHNSHFKGELLFFNAGESPEIPHYSQQDLLPCEKPMSVDQSVWRDGLAQPKSGRIQQEVNHIIIHHSAGSNAITDYTRAVREIYLLHTEGNGWDDIGYNYLIAPDGVIYKGRDPENYEQDEVKGAHFCAKNSYTLGICLLGNYEDIAPSDTMMGSLRQLISWKLNKEDLNPLDSFDHLPGSQNAYPLGVIAGHEDGCPTTCPGREMVNMLPTLKTEVEKQIEGCQRNSLSSISELSKIEFQWINNSLLIYANAQGHFKLSLYDTRGRLVDEGKVIWMQRRAGKLFIVQLIDESGQIHFEKLIY